jgi:hypothetical protein
MNLCLRPQVRSEIKEIQVLIAQVLEEKKLQILMISAVVDIQVKLAVKVLEELTKKGVETPVPIVEMKDVVEAVLERAIGVAIKEAIEVTAGTIRENP